MFCPKCGNQVDDKAVICVGCGQPLKAIMKTEKVSAGWWWLGFLFPLLGFVLWAVWTGEKPRKARKVGLGALTSLIVCGVLIVLYFVFIVGVIAYVAAY